MAAQRGEWVYFREPSLLKVGPPHWKVGPPYLKVDPPRYPDISDNVVTSNARMVANLYKYLACCLLLAPWSYPLPQQPYESFGYVSSPAPARYRSRRSCVSLVHPPTLTRLVVSFSGEQYSLAWSNWTAPRLHLLQLLLPNCVRFSNSCSSASARYHAHAVLGIISPDIQ